MQNFKNLTTFLQLSLATEGHWNLLPTVSLTVFGDVVVTVNTISFRALVGRHVHASPAKISGDGIFFFENVSL